MISALGNVKTEKLATYIDNIDNLFPDFSNNDDINLELVESYYNDSYWGYRLFHSWSGAIHMAMSENGRFSKNDYFTQAEEIGDIIEDGSLKASSRILEIGCGAGFNLTYLGERFPNIHFTGIDISKKNLESAANRTQHLKNVTIQYGDFTTANDLFEEEFDLICAIECFCHASDPQAAIDALSKTLSKSGVLVIFDGYRQHKTVGNPLQQKAVEYVERAMAVPRFFAINEMRNFLSCSGYDSVKIYDRSEEIIPNLIRLSDLAKSYFKSPFLSKLLARLLPRGLIYNSIAGLLMAITVTEKHHRYLKIVARKHK